MSRSLIVMPDDSAEADSRSDRGSEKVAAHQDVPVLRPGAARRRDRGAEARRQGAGDAEPGAARRRARERGHAQEARESGRRGDRQQPGVRGHAREVDGGGRRDRVREVAQLGDEEPDRDPRLRDRDLAPPRSRRGRGGLRGRLAPEGLRPRSGARISSGARSTAATGSPSSSTRPSTRCSSRTSATRIRSSSSAWCGPRAAASRST